MDAWVMWLILGVVLAAGEIMTLSFYLGPFGLGALAAAGASAAGAGDVESGLIFLAASTVTLGIVRPIARAHRRQPPQLRTGTAALIGKRAAVLERIDNHAGTGRVRLEGEVWTARTLDDESVVEAGADVQVIEIRGATALVSE